MTQRSQKSKTGQETEAGRSGVGAKLRAARTARGLEVGDIARQLNLPAAVVEAIESEDFSAPGLPEQVYVRGYVLAYVRLLELPDQEAEALVGGVNTVTGGDRRPLQVRRPVRAQARWNDALIRWVSVALGCLVVGLFAVWGYDWVRGVLDGDQVVAQQGADTSVALQESDGEGALLVPPMEPVDGLPPMPSPSASLPVSIGEPLNDPLGDPAEPAPETLPMGGEAEDATGDLALAGSALQEEAGRALAVGTEEPVGSDAPQAGPPETETAATVPAAAAEPVPEGDRLVLSFERDCWIEIRDAEDTRLAYGLAKAGSERVLQGVAPFSLVLGDSTGVSIELNGEAVEPDSFRRRDGRPARFVLDGAAASG